MKYAGIDVSAKQLVVALEPTPGDVRTLNFENSPKGHKTLIQILACRKDAVRVCLEPTGSYHLDLALALARTNGCEVMVANPRATRNFAKAMMTRGKDDPLDANVLLQFAKRMEFQVWNPPSDCILSLRAITRRALQLTHDLTMEKNRLHAASASISTPKSAIESLQAHIVFLTQVIERLNRSAVEQALATPELHVPFGLLLSVKGLGEVSAARLLPELLILPKDMEARQWVAHAGLDPKPMKSGSSLNRPSHISKAGNAYLRQILYLPALTAIKWEPSIKAYYLHLTSDRHKKPLQAQVAVMRKLLHAFHSMLFTKTVFDGSLFYAAPRAPLTAN